jgi:hypothetical protein
MFTSNATSAYQSKTMATLSSFVITWNEAPGVPSWWIMPKIGVGITLTMAPNTRARSETVISIAHRKVAEVGEASQPTTHEDETGRCSIIRAARPSFRS